MWTAGWPSEWPSGLPVASTSGWPMYYLCRYRYRHRRYRPGQRPHHLHRFRIDHPGDHTCPPTGCQLRRHVRLTGNTGVPYRLSSRTWGFPHGRIDWTYRSDLDPPRGNEGTAPRLVRPRVVLADDRPVIVALPALEHIDQFEERGEWVSNEVTRQDRPRSPGRGAHSRDRVFVGRPWYG